MAENTIPAAKITSNEAFEQAGFDVTYEDGTKFRVPRPSPTTVVAFERKFKVSFTTHNPNFEQFMWQIWHTCKRKQLYPKDCPISTFDKWLDTVEQCDPVMTPKLLEMMEQQGTPIG